MNAPNRHHYLPIFYLNRWIGADLRVVRFYRPYRDVVASRITPEYTGFEEGLYALEGSKGGAQQVIETEFLSPIDNEAAVILGELTTHGANGLNEAQRSRWVRFIMSLQLRGPHSLTEIEDLFNQSMEKVSKGQRIEQGEGTTLEEPGQTYEDAREKSPVEFKSDYKRLLPRLIDHPNIGQRIINMLWHVLDFSRAPYTLLTSDRPFAASHGYLDAKCIVSVPLSPTHLFVAVNDDRQLHWLANRNRGETVRDANALMVHLAVQNVYGASADHLRFVENRLRRHGDLIVPGVITRGLRE